MWLAYQQTVSTGHDGHNVVRAVSHGDDDHHDDDDEEGTERMKTPLVYRQQLATPLHEALRK